MHNFKNEMLKLYAITDPRYSKGNVEKFLTQIEIALKSGITCLQLREKNAIEASFIKKAILVKKLCKKYNIPLIINDNFKIAKNVSADGVHIGQKDASLVEVIAELGKNKIVGVSATSVEEAVQAEKNGATYLGVGSIFFTKNKKDAKKVSISMLKKICSNVSIPVVAIGGISKSNIEKLKSTGISGIAAIDAIFSEENIESAVKNLKLLVDKIT